MAMREKRSEKNVLSVSRGIGTIRAQVMTTTIEVFPDADALARTVAHRLIETARAKVAEQGVFTLALSGGSTPKKLHRELTAAGGDLPWDSIHLFFGDERNVGPDHEDSNFRMARETLLDSISIPAENVHRILAEQEARQAAAEYEVDLREFFESRNLIREGFPTFDVILLGMGDDGHTASLFPGTEALHEKAQWVAGNQVPQLETNRITLTYPVINHAAEVMLLVAGAGKADRLEEVLHTRKGEAAYPVQGVQPVGALRWMLDEAAAAKLPADIYTKV